jgi:hypothetical protein
LYGRFELDMSSHLEGPDLRPAPATSSRTHTAWPGSERCRVLKPGSRLRNGERGFRSARPAPGDRRR